MSDRPPSRLRVPLSILLGLVMPPVGLVTWIALSGSQRRDYLASNLVRTGLGIGLASALPLVTVGLAAALGTDV